MTRPSRFRARRPDSGRPAERSSVAKRLRLAISAVARRYRNVPLSSSVIVLAYVVAAAVILPAASMIVIGRVPAFLRRDFSASQPRTRIEGVGLLLIGFFILADALAADLGRRSAVPQDWILLVWIALAAGLIGIRYLAGRAEQSGNKNSQLR